MSEVAMQCFLEAGEPENVVWVFESIPAWKGDLFSLPNHNQRRDNLTLT